ncbi:MAG: hypothetical protein M1825_001425 [Sarcosagium campestre]|nr:MAG: hypothetical protein M1825_001425 [Sarcosagium campestre]
MANIESGATFGAELKDAFRPANAWVSIGITWLDDLQQFYRDRSLIEKEYSTKLNALAKKYLEKKSKKSSVLSVGETPTMTPGSLESASLTTWGMQLTTLEDRAAEHDQFSQDLISQVSEPLKQASVQYEETRRRHAEYAVRLEKERDSAHSDLRKRKVSYDSVCQDVESRRKKVETSFDSSKQKAKNVYLQQIAEMNNVKNLQDLSEARTEMLNSVWSTAVHVENSCLSQGIRHLQQLRTEIPRNDPNLDSVMFIRHNLGGFQEPPDLSFEPSPVWHDDSSMILDDAAQVFLRNIMRKSKGQLVDLMREYDRKNREIIGVKSTRRRLKEGKEKRDAIDLVNTLLSLQEELHRIDHQKVNAEVETSVIKAAIGDVSSGARDHSFISQTFKIPTNCDLCGERIWGLSAKGFDCKDCGYTCHGKCELKIPATCPGEQHKDEKKKLKIERQLVANTMAPNANGSEQGKTTTVSNLVRSDTMTTLSSGYATNAHRSVTGLSVKPMDGLGFEKAEPPSSSKIKPNTSRRNRIVAPPPTAYTTEIPSDIDIENSDFSQSAGSQQSRMLYTYQQNGDGEISVDEGTSVTVVEPDDGSGWTLVRTNGSEGLVPTAYVEISHAPFTPKDRPVSAYSSSSASLASSGAPASRKKGPAVAPKRGAKKLSYVEALYDYDARSDAEWSMAVGDRFVLIHKDSGDGWADVEKGGIIKSVPANYIEAAD